jgi:hypothetical protein
MLLLCLMLLLLCWCYACCCCCYAGASWCYIYMLVIATCITGILKIWVASFAWNVDLLPFWQNLCTP